MVENEERRRAHRQKRGLRRREEILRAAGALFAEVGYDRATTNLVAERAGVSPGSLYQFFPNKEAIAQAYAADAVAHLHGVYDALLAAPVIALPFPDFVDRFVDDLLAFNRRFPGYLALALASTISAPLAEALMAFQRGVFGRLDAILAALWPGSRPEQRRLPILFGQRTFVALLPFTHLDDGEKRDAVVREIKTMVRRYWGPLVDAPDPSVLPALSVADASHRSGSREQSLP